MKLKPSKCSFGEEEGPFLGHFITARGIKANRKKIEVIERIPSPKTKKQVQSLNGKLATLTRFLSKAAERSLPFFSTLKNCAKKSDFKWTEEAEKAFQEMKALLKDLPTLTAPIAGETLILYLGIAQEAVSSVLIAERDGVQTPIYFVSKALSGSELNYRPIEKFVYALVITARRLRRYFQAHPIVVLTDQPICQIQYKPETSGRLTKWAIELGEHEINFCARSPVKGQILADYLAETTADMPITLDLETIAPVPEFWELYTDGASGPEGAGTGVLLTVPNKEEHTYALRFNIKATNNEAEYEALLAGVRLAKEIGVKKLQAYVDSQLVANQINGTFDAHDEGMQSYLALARCLVSEFDDFQISQVPRTQNKAADVLSKLAALKFNHLEKKVLVEEVFKKPIELNPLVAAVEETESCWMTNIFEFLKTGLLHEDEKEAKKIGIKAPMYELRDDTLYRKSYLGPSYRCVRAQAGRKYHRRSSRRIVRITFWFQNSRGEN
ncbi:uncharacterized protein [Rutidosis leptorrhynchoides]|uniref:uncharacterized protein n=1 Tax=Rutidosis leptorrhynchoides TaxID=125765 RepID=UPI003A99E535